MSIKSEKHDFNWKMKDTRARILAAMLPEVPFDGWSAESYKNALRNSAVDEMHAKLAFPKGALDVAIEFHRVADQEMRAALPDRVALVNGVGKRVYEAVLLRFEIAAREKEAVRRAASLMALPQNAGTGAGLIWETVDHIWRGIGDEAQGFEHYSKRTSLAAVYSSTFLFWLQDESVEMKETRAFLERRLKDIQSFGRLTAMFKRPFEMKKEEMRK